MQLILTFLGAVLLMNVSSAEAKLVQKTIEYKHDSTILEGYLAYDDTSKESRSGVLVVHDWYGLTEKTKAKVDALAKLGYIAFAADIYGKGIRPVDPKEAGKQASLYKSDRKLLRERAAAALNTLGQQPQIKANSLSAIGYCFGGLVALELARHGAPLKAAVSFHGSLDTPDTSLAKNIKGKVLVFHGADDPFVPAKDIDAFEQEMRTAKVDWQLIKFGNAVHSFTDKSAGNDNAKGAAYNALADQRSWMIMEGFFRDLL